MVTINQLSKNYSGLLALDGISLEIPEGQVMGLLGPNGAGKSTTLRILTGFLEPSEGTVIVDGKDIREEPQAAKSIIGYLPESSPLYTDMLVYDYLLYIAEARGIAKEKQKPRLKELASLCGIDTVMHKSISELSKGYRQRVGLALAMMSDPKILVLDEPTSGLDPNQISEIREIIKEIGKQKTVLFSTHILSEAEATCDRIVIIDRGKIIADGKTKELIEERGTSSLDLHLKSATLSEAKAELENLEGVKAIEGKVNGETLELKLECLSDVRETVYHRVRSKEWTLLELHQRTQSLEEIFIELTQGGKN